MTMASGRPSNPEPGDRYEEQWPDGATTIYEYQAGPYPQDPYLEAKWVALRTITPRQAPQGPSAISISNTVEDNARADAKFEYEKERDRLLDEEKRLKAERDRADEALDRAIAAENAKVAAEIRAEQKERQARIDAINEEQRQRDNEYRDKTLAIAEGNLDINRGNLDIAEGDAELRRRRYEDDLANQPGNAYNNMFRTRGMEPPSNQPATAQQAPQGQRPWWENYSLERLEGFPDSELMNLPQEIIDKFRNEFALKRPAIMALMSPERIRGTGKYQGTGFAQEIINSLGKSAPAPPMPKPGVPPTITPPGAALPIGGTGKPLYNTPTGAPAPIAAPGAPLPIGGVSKPVFNTPTGEMQPPQAAVDPRVEEAIRMAEAAKGA